MGREAGGEEPYLWYPDRDDMTYHSSNSHVASAHSTVSVWYISGRKLARKEETLRASVCNDSCNLPFSWALFSFRIDKQTPCSPPIFKERQGQSLLVIRLDLHVSLCCDYYCCFSSFFPDRPDTGAFPAYIRGCLKLCSSRKKKIPTTRTLEAVAPKG